MSFTRTFAVLVGSLVTGVAVAETDQQLWTSVGARVRLHEDVRLDFAQQVRFDQNVSSLESVLPELTLAWNIQKWVRLGTGYRYSAQRRKDQTFSPEHRLHVQGSARGQVGPVSAAYRVRYQKRFERDPVLEVKRTVRSRVSAEYETQTLFTPGLSLEQFTVVGGGSKPLQEKRRYTASAEFRPSKSHALEGFFRHQRRLDDSSAIVERIVGLEYQFRFASN